MILLSKIRDDDIREFKECAMRMNEILNRIWDSSDKAPHLYVTPGSFNLMSDSFDSWSKLSDEDKDKLLVVSVTIDNVESGDW